MAPRHQNTFTLVPNPLGIQGLMARPTNGPHSKPPMTSKQAQKLYREATRGPRLSKAEQRRIEREEQERIRRELDKEKQANKARTLREKKKAKEQQAKEEKRRKGLPLVQVRPSQDTIARFVRGNNGGAKKRDSTGAPKVGLTAIEEHSAEVGPTTTDEMDEDLPVEQSDDGNACKRRRLSYGTEEAVGRADDLAEAAPCAMEKSQVGITSSLKEPATLAKPTEPAWEKNPTVADGNPRSPPNVGAADDECKLHNVPSLRRGTPAQDMPNHNKDVRATPKSQPKTTAAAPVPKAVTTTPQIPKTQHSAAKRSAPPPPPQEPNYTPVQPPSNRGVLREITNSSNRPWRASATGNTAKFSSPYHKPALTTPRVATPGTVPVPVFKHPRPVTPADRVPRPHFLPPHLRKSGSDQQVPAAVNKGDAPSPQSDFMSAPPTSTQLFVMSHIDDLFPSPSQEARELSGSSPAPAAKELKPAPAKPLIAKYTAKCASRPREPAPSPLVRPFITIKKQGATKPDLAFDISFISTQDLVFSSQDLRDIEEPTPCKKKHNGVRPPPFKKNTVTSQPRPSPLPRSIESAVPAPQARTAPAPVTKEQRPTSGGRPLPPRTEPQDQGCATAKLRPVPGRPQRPQFDTSTPLPCQNPSTEKNAPVKGTSTRPPSPEKPRFFGSSSGVQTLLAIGESRKTYEEEKRRRLAESGAQGARGCHEAAEKDAKTSSQGKASACCTASQESDYGDVELDSIDFAELGLDCI